MSAGVVWAFVAALGFGVTQTLNRKSNLVIGAYRTAFALLVGVEAVLVVRGIVTGELARIAEAPASSIAFFTGSATIHYVAGWTLLALSQDRIGVARTGAVTSLSPLVAALMAASFLGEPLTVPIVAGVVLCVLGVTLVSMSRVTGGKWRVPWFGIGVATCWGSSPTLIRKGLVGFDAPLLGLTIGLGLALVLGGIALASAGGFRRGTWHRTGIGWAAVGGITGAVGIGAQWISFDLIEIAVAFTIQQLATLVVVALAPIMFDSAQERINTRLLLGTAALIGGSVIVVWARGG